MPAADYGLISRESELVTSVTNQFSMRRSELHPANRYAEEIIEINARLVNAIA